MKGVIFTEFLDMVDDAFSPAVTERILQQAAPASGGAYTAVGTYNHGEMLSLVGALSEETGQAAPDLVATYGRHLFSRFVTLYPHFFEGIADAFSFLENVENYIHVEVKKLYSDAKLPTIDCRRSEPGVLEIEYRSHRPLAEVCHGLIVGCLDHYGETAEIDVKDLDDGAGRHVLFVVRTHA